MCHYCVLCLAPGDDAIFRSVITLGVQTIVEKKGFPQFQISAPPDQIELVVREICEVIRIHAILFVPGSVFRYDFLSNEISKELPSRRVEGAHGYDEARVIHDDPPLSFPGIYINIFDGLSKIDDPAVQLADILHGADQLILHRRRAF